MRLMDERRTRLLDTFAYLPSVATVLVLISCTGTMGVVHLRIMIIPRACGNLLECVRKTLEKDFPGGPRACTVQAVEE
jgi:hypothetical protein